MKVGERLQFKKFDWVLVSKKKHYPFSEPEYRYRVYRKYLRLGKKYLIPMTNTKCNYTIYPWRWNFIKRQLAKNPEYHYTMHL